MANIEAKSEPGMISSTSAMSKQEKEAVNKPLLPVMDTKPMTISDISGFHPLGIARFLVNLFSRFDKQRDPPSSPGKSKHLRMVTIGPSPFCEKARWGLDLLEQDENSPYYYTEDAHPSGFHSFQTVPITKGAYSSTPVIVFPDGSYRAHSNKVLSELCPFLYPAEIAEDLKQFEMDMGTRLGAPARLLLFYYMVDPGKKHYKALIKQQCYGISTVETTLFKNMFGLGVDKALKESLNFNEETAKASIDSIQAVMAEISERLDRNGGEYIFDTPEKKYGFTAADLTFAALSTLIIQLDQMSNFAIPKEDMPAEYAQLSESLSQTKAGLHCQKLYQKNRPLHSDGKVQIKTVNRDRNPFKFWR